MTPRATASAQLLTRFARQARADFVGESVVDDVDLAWLHEYLQQDDWKAPQAVAMECANFLAMLEVSACAGVMEPQLAVTGVLAVKAMQKCIPLGPPRTVSFWRLGLVADLGHLRSEKDLSADDVPAGVQYQMSEYFGLVDEFRLSREGQAFREWVRDESIDAISKDLLNSRRRLKYFMPEREFDSDATNPQLVLDGLEQYLALVENCYLVLGNLRQFAHLQSACWCFHGGLFSHDRIVSRVAKCLEVVEDTLRHGGQPSDPIDQELEDPQEIVEQYEHSMAALQRQRAAWNSLSSARLWKGERAPAKWKELADPKLSVSMLKRFKMLKLGLGGYDGGGEGMSM